MAPEAHDAQVRLQAFGWLRRQKDLHGEILPRDLLAAGFEFEGQRVPLISPKGIFKPQVLPEIPLTITTVPPSPRKDRPYEDEISYEGFLLYKYRGTDPAHPDNVGLRKAMQQKAPLIYLYGLVPGYYSPVFPVYVIRDDPDMLTFTVAVDEANYQTVGNYIGEDDVEARRRYITQVTRKRLHQQRFREQVLTAYARRCAICHLRHTELLEAAHILHDSHPKGQPVVQNGLSFCMLHHAAFDRNLLAVRPDYTIELRPDILDEDDGPMLVHGIQEFHQKKILLPKKVRLQPDPERLGERYAIFRSST